MSKELPANVIEYAIKRLHIVPVKKEVSISSYGDGNKKYTKYGLEIDNLYTLSKPTKNVIKSIFSYQKYDTFYNDFREVVPNLSDEELYVNAIIHYLGFSEKPLFGELSENKKKDIKGLEKEVKLSPISSKNEVASQVITSLFSQTISPSLEDESTVKEAIQWLIEAMGFSLDEVEDSPNSSVIRNIIFTLGVPNMVKLKVVVLSVVPTLIPYYINNASDLVKYLEVTNKITYKRSGKDVKKFKPFFELTSDEVKMFSKSIDKFNENDLATNVELFKRFLVAYKKTISKKVYNSLKEKLYNHPRSFESIINNENNVDTIIKRVPVSIIIRNIVHLVKRGTLNGDNIDYFMQYLTQKEIPSRVLVQIYNNLTTIVYNKPKKRIVKRNTGVELIDSVSLNKPEISVLKDAIKWIESALSSVSDSILQERVADSVTDSYDLAIPTSGEEQPKSFHTTYEGTKIPLNEDEDVSLFIYWKGNFDIDLSATFLSNDAKDVADVSYMNIKENLSGSSKVITHSGDITRAPKGAVEEIYIPKDTVKDYRYVLVSVVSYRGEPLREVENLGFGFGNRHTTKENLNPKDLYGFSVDANQSMVLLIDLEENVAKVVNISGGNEYFYSTRSHIDELADRIEILNSKNYLSYNKLEEIKGK